MENIIHCLELRLTWYQKSIDMMSGKIPLENGFDFPTSTNNCMEDSTALYEWRGAERELRNLIDMLKHDSKQ